MRTSKIKFAVASMNMFFFSWSCITTLKFILNPKIFFLLRQKVNVIDKNRNTNSKISKNIEKNNVRLMLVKVLSMIQVWNYLIMLNSTTMLKIQDKTIWWYWSKHVVGALEQTFEYCIKPFSIRMLQLPFTSTRYFIAKPKS